MGKEPSKAGFFRHETNRQYINDEISFRFAKSEIRSIHTTWQKMCFTIEEHQKNTSNKKRTDFVIMKQHEESKPQKRNNFWIH